MPPKMRTWWVHRELEAMKEIASSDQGGEKDGLVGLGIRLEGTSRLGTFYCCPSMSPVRLMRLFILDKQPLMLPLPSIPIASSTSTMPNTVAVSSVSPFTSFANLSLLPPAFAYSPQHPPCDEVSSLRARPNANDEPSSTSEDPSSWRRRNGPSQKDSGCGSSQSYVSHPAIASGR
jgi:hypothetical protein